MAKQNKTKWDALSMKDRASFIRIGIKNGITDIEEIKRQYNEYSHTLERVDRTNTSDGVQRLKDPNREVLRNPDGSVSTHEYEWGTDDKGNAIIYPTVQSTPEGLRRFNSEDAYDRAIEKRDTIMMSPEEADWWTKNNYKAHYPTFNKYADGGIIQKIDNWISNTPLGKFMQKRNLVIKNNSGNSEATNHDNYILRPSKFDRIRENDSRGTQQESSAAEDRIAEMQRNLQTFAHKKGYTSDEDYYIPYNIDQEIKTKRGRVTKNMLDSLAVNAEKEGIPIEEAIGLAALETHFGASPNRAADPDASKEEKKKFERISGNMSYARSRGGIYPQFLVNDHEWSIRGSGARTTKRLGLDTIKSPLQHAFRLYKHGLYNPGETSHTMKVQSLGKDLMTTDPAIIQWKKEYDNKKATGGELEGLEESPATQRSSQEYINGAKSFLMEVAEKIAFGYPYTPSISEHIEQAKNNKYEDLSRSAFLFSKEEQEKAFSDAGYIIDTSGNYGLVKKAVGNRKLPIYKKNKDVIDRSQLTPIFNLDSRWLGSRESRLEDPGEFPSVVYKDKNGNFYQNAWDLQDYGESSAGSGGHRYPKIKQLAANLLDVIGNPFVVTTGIQPVDPYEMFMYAHGKPELLKDFYKTLNKDEVYKLQTHSAKYLYYDYKNRQRHIGNKSIVSFKDFIEHIDKYTTKEEQIKNGYLKDF